MQCRRKGIFFFYKNESKRVRVQCIPGYPFLLHCSWEERYKCFQLKTCELEHLCNLQYRLKCVSTKWLASRYDEYIMNDLTVTQTEMKQHIKDDIKIWVCDSTARWVIEAVKHKMKQVYSEQFKKLRNYAQELLNSNPGSTITIQTERVSPDAPCTFQRIYVCFAPMKKGFLAGCRKVIGLDGCFLKGALKGEFLSAIGGMLITRCIQSHGQ